MKVLLALFAAAAMPALALAQSQAQPASPKSNTAAKPAPGTKKVAPRTVRAQPDTRSAAARRAEAVKAAEEATPIEEPDPSIKLSDAERELAKKVFVGEIPCELGANVRIRPLRREGFFLVQHRITRFVMHPVESKTGALRLEDPTQGALWIQLGNKSMLMSQKLGQRLADECQSPDQKTYAEELKKNPINLLEAPRAAAAPAVAPAAAPAASAASEPEKSGPPD